MTHLYKLLLMATLTLLSCTPATSGEEYILDNSEGELSEDSNDLEGEDNEGLLGDDGSNQEGGNESDGAEDELGQAYDDNDDDQNNKDNDDSDEPSYVPIYGYITKVFDYLPAVGEEVNLKPLYEDGDTQQSMNAKVLEAIGGNTQEEITLGGWGGYVVVGFDNTIKNRPDECDFRVISSADYRESYPSTGGTFEPGVVMVAYDSNSNGIPDDEWYEVWGSAHIEPYAHSWYSSAEDAGINTNLYLDYQVSYSTIEGRLYWEDNKGDSGEITSNELYNSNLASYPEWCSDSEISFSGTHLPCNGVDISPSWYPYSDFILFRFDWGYADNARSDEAEAWIDIDWARDSGGNPVSISSIDFIKIYTGVNQLCDERGEVSTKLAAIEYVAN